MKLDEFAFANQQLAGRWQTGIPLEASLQRLRTMSTVMLLLNGATVLLFAAGLFRLVSLIETGWRGRH